MQGIAIAIKHDRMASIRATVVTHNDIMLGSEQINDLAFAFVAPLEANHGGGTSWCHPVHGRGGDQDSRRTVTSVEPRVSVTDIDTRKVTGPI